MGSLLRTLQVGGLVALQAGVVWKSIVNSACWRTPWTEIRGNPLLTDLLVPSVFHIRSVAQLDVGLHAFITALGVAVPAAYLRDGYLYLEGRIRFLADQGHLANAPALHAIRRRRNDLAHKVDANIEWGVFDTDAAQIEASLLHLGLQAQANTVHELRQIAKYLQRPAHRKFYLGAKGMLLAGAVEACTLIIVERQIARAVRDSEPVRRSRWEARYG